jgi:hypothetical protein
MALVGVRGARQCSTVLEKNLSQNQVLTAMHRCSLERGAVRRVAACAATTKSIPLRRTEPVQSADERAQAP